MKKISTKFYQVPIGEFLKLLLKWEFPGGNLEPNENEGIKREINEELVIEITKIKRLIPTFFEYTNESILLILFLVKYMKKSKFKKAQRILIIG